MRAFLTYASYRLLGSLAGRLPPQFGYWMAGWTGWLLHVLSPRLRRVLASNIRHVVAPNGNGSNIQALERQACVNIMKGHYDLFRVGRLSRKEIEDRVHLQGWENLEKALAQGRGVLLLSAHLGNVDVVMQLAPLRGILTVAPVQRTQPERLFQYTLGLRKSHGIKFIPSDEPMIGLFRALKQGGIVALAADRDVTDNARVVSFFGTPTRLPDGPVRLALRTGAPLVPAFAVRLPDESFLVQIEPPLQLPRTGNEEADAGEAMRLVVETMERHIAQHPEQWLVSQPIWPVE